MKINTVILSRQDYDNFIELEKQTKEGKTLVCTTTYGRFLHFDRNYYTNDELIKELIDEKEAWQAEKKELQGEIDAQKKIADMSLKNITKLTRQIIKLKGENIFGFLIRKKSTE